MFSFPSYCGRSTVRSFLLFAVYLFQDFLWVCQETSERLVDQIADRSLEQSPRLPALRASWPDRAAAKSWHQTRPRLRKSSHSMGSVLLAVLGDIRFRRTVRDGLARGPPHRGEAGCGSPGHIRSA